MNKNILFNLTSFLSLLFTIILTSCTYKNDSISLAEKDEVNPPGIEQTKVLAEEAYIYGFPMIAAYKALYQFNVDKASGQYKGAFNTIINDSQVFTYKDTAIVTPNSDGSLTIYAQNKSPGIDKESNWLPAPNGPIYMVMRLYWPKVTTPSILPAGQGTWAPPLIKQVALE